MIQFVSVCACEESFSKRTYGKWWWVKLWVLVIRLVMLAMVGTLARDGSISCPLPQDL